MKTIQDVYNEYKIGKHLQLHMLRVASVASVICDGIDIPVNKDNIVKAALPHDAANILKVDFSFFPEFWEPEGIEYWQGVKNQYAEKYGNNEHDATIQIMQEFGVSESVISLVDEVRFTLLCKHFETEDFDIKILHYADLIVGPYGVLTFDKRMTEAKARYKNHKNGVAENEWNRLYDCGQKMKKQIFEKCKISPDDINDELVVPIIEKLRNFVI